MLVISPPPHLHSPDSPPRRRLAPRPLPYWPASTSPSSSNDDRCSMRSTSHSMPSARRRPELAISPPAADDKRLRSDATSPLSLSAPPSTNRSSYTTALSATRKPEPLKTPAPRPGRNGLIARSAVVKESFNIDFSFLDDEPPPSSHQNLWALPEPPSLSRPAAPKPAPPMWTQPKTPETSELEEEQGEEVEVEESELEDDVSETEAIYSFFSPNASTRSARSLRSGERGSPLPFAGNRQSGLVFPSRPRQADSPASRPESLPRRTSARMDARHVSQSSNDSSSSDGESSFARVDPSRLSRSIRSSRGSRGTSIDVIQEYASMHHDESEKGGAQKSWKQLAVMLDESAAAMESGRPISTATAASAELFGTYTLQGSASSDSRPTSTVQPMNQSPRSKSTTRSTSSRSSRRRESSQVFPSQRDLPPVPSLSNDASRDDKTEIPSASDGYDATDESGESQQPSRALTMYFTPSKGTPNFSLSDSKTVAAVPSAPESTEELLSGELDEEGFSDSDADAVALELENQLSELARQQEAAAEADARRAEKRKRIISELIETEMTFATDMAVVRDIYFARAKGVDLAVIADHVMSSGLGLWQPSSPSTPTRLPDGFGSTERRGSLATPDRRPPMPPRQNSGSLRQQAVFSSKDLHIVFANLEQITSLAEAFAGVLDGARGDNTKNSDRIGETFVEMMPRIQDVFATYCARHHRAIGRLQEMEPSLRSYLQDCKTLSHGRTNAWDLASLLIKPVQRCLKYPLLLNQILEKTPRSHPDYANLQLANEQMLAVAAHINEVKKRHDTVEQVIARRDPATRARESSFSKPSMGTAGKMTKKLLRSTQKARASETVNDEMFDSLTGLVDSTRSSVLRFANEMRQWSKSTKQALEAQVDLVENWCDVYTPLEEEPGQVDPSRERLAVFLDYVLQPILRGPWANLDGEIKTALLVKTEHLLSLFENPRSVIAKRNDKLLAHSRYLAKKNPADRKASDEFLMLSHQLLEELPKFLASVSRYFDIIVAHFAEAQASFYDAVQSRWNEFAAQYCQVVPRGDPASIKESLLREQLPLAQMMQVLASGLGVRMDTSSMPAPMPRISTHRSRSYPAGGAGALATAVSPLGGMLSLPPTSLGPSSLGPREGASPFSRDVVEGLGMSAGAPKSTSPRSAVGGRASLVPLASPPLVAVPTSPSSSRPALRYTGSAPAPRRPAYI